MLTRTYAFLEPFVAATRPARLVLVRRFLIALERSLKAPGELDGACHVAGTVLGMPPQALATAAAAGEDAFDLFLERALPERLAAAPEGLDARADWLIRWGPLVEALVPDGPHGASTVPDMVTLAPDLAALFARLPELARSPLPLMLEGQPGTGRESLARAIHAGYRAPRPFLTFDARQPERSADQIIFGGAVAPGLLWQAAEGTLLVRSAEYLSIATQQRLARCLELGVIVDEAGRPGAPLRTRLITAVGDGALAGTDPEQGRLTPDFAHRASTLYARLPSLAARGEDMAALYRNVVRRFVLRREVPLSAEEVQREPRMTLTPRALLALYAYEWPGNVAEFVAVVREARQRAGGGAVELAHLPERVVAALGRTSGAPGDRLRELLVDIAPAAVAGADEAIHTRKRLRGWRDFELSRRIGREANDAIARAVATFNAMRAGQFGALDADAAIAQVRAAAAREILLPTGTAVPLFWEERVELVSELEALAAAHPVPGAISRRLFDLGRALVLYPEQAATQLATGPGADPRRSPLVLGMIDAAR